ARMTFTSPSFFLFLFAALLAFWSAGDRWRWLVLLIGSYVFYASLGKWYLLVALALVTVICYLGGLALGREQEPGRRARILGISIASCLAVLFATKYLPHFEIAYRYLGPVISIGVSYFTFQGISYLIDLYLGVREPDRHMGYFALYMAFFPKLLQGPIERA